MNTNKTYNENCLDTMAKMPNNFIDLTVTSPPYDDLRNYKGYSFDFDGIAKELFRVTKEGGILVWIVGDKVNKGTESGTSFKQALYFKECGFNLHDTMIYGKNNPFGTCGNPPKRYSQAFEYMFVLTKGKLKTFNPIKIECVKSGVKTSLTTRKNRQSDGLPFDYLRSKTDIVKSTKIKSNIWMYDTGNNKTTKDRMAFKHPAVFPEQLANDHIISWSNEYDLVYDPFMGSGTVAKMAHINRRNWIGSEISVEYCNIIKERLNKLW